MEGRKDNLEKINRYIFWIDKNIKCYENQYYLKCLQQEFSPKIEIETFDSIENYENFLKEKKDKYDFKFIYIIISGNLAEKFFDNYNSFAYTTIIASTIVFCEDINLHSSKPYANDLYLNPGGIVNIFDEVIEYIHNPNDRLWHHLLSIKENSINIPILHDKSGNVFKYAQDLSEITLPIILTEIIKKNLISEESMVKFQEFIFSKYRYFNKGEKIIPLVKHSLEKKVYIPLTKIAKYFIRLYTLDTDFHIELNKYLSNIDGFGPYKIFILILYFSIQNQSLRSYADKKLYRGTMLSTKELNEIISIVDKANEILEPKEGSSFIKINLSSDDISIRENDKAENKISSALYYSKPFMSFSKNRDVALNFLREINDSNKNRLRRVLFILNPPKEKDKIFFSNIDIDETNLSAFSEEEVLFLPFSCFEIESYKKTGEFDYEITLNYLDKYYNQLQRKISGMKNDVEIKSFYEKVLESPFSQNVIDGLDDYKNIYDNINDFFSGNFSIQNQKLIINKIIPNLPHIVGNAVGYNLAYIDDFIKLSKADKIKTIGENFGLPIGIAILDNIVKWVVYLITTLFSVPSISTLLLGGSFIYDIISDIRNPTLTKKETAISILKNTSNLSANIGAEIGGFYAGLKIGISLGIVTGPGSIMIGIGSGLLGGLIGGLFGRFFCSTKMVLKCNSFYKNYIPLKFRKESNIPDLFWENVNKNTKSFALEAIIDHNEKHKTWSVINMPPQLRKISPNVGETLIKYGNFFQYNPSNVDFLLYSIKKEKITEEDWNEPNKRRELIIDIAILEVNHL